MAESRFIPARAGNTEQGRIPPPPSAVHPRACGEHDEPHRGRRHHGGSSPRVRGTRRPRSPRRTRRRFIPARAGNTTGVLSRRARRTVHPRACGEHAAPSWRAAPWPGSSPRVRGTRDARRRHRLPERFIPARAGNTAARRGVPAPGAVHPRACGEHSEELTAASEGAGSSPRVRGTHPQGAPDSGDHRFIPARAGNTR